MGGGHGLNASPLQRGQGVSLALVSWSRGKAKVDCWATLDDLDQTKVAWWATLDDFYRTKADRLATLGDLDGTEVDWWATLGDQK